MNCDTKKFSIDDIYEVATDDSVEFAIARMCVLSTKPNSHGVVITEDILKACAKTCLGKWIIADYDKWKNDTTTHTPKTHIVGMIPNDAKIEFVRTKDGYLAMYVDAIISKLYATDVYRMFRDGENFRNVSVEMSTINDRKNEYGNIEIDGFKIYSVCILGIEVNGSCPDANMSIIQFSADSAEKYYDKKCLCFLYKENDVFKRIKEKYTRKE